MKVKDVTSKIGSGATPTGGEKVYKEDGICLIRSQNVLDMSFSYDGLAHIDADRAQKLDGVIVKKNDILLNITGDSIARCCIVPDDVLPARVNQHVAIIRASKTLPEYLLYYLQFLKPHLMQICKVGGTRNALTKEAIEELPFWEIEDANSAVSILHDIDTKLINNNAICSILEAMAKELYDYWFVQFDFPDENGKPYKSSGGKMVWNEKLKREIPEGWTAGVLGDVIVNYSNGISPKDVGELPYTPMDILPMRQMSFSETGNQDDANSSLIHYKKYALLFGAMRPYFHRVCIAPFDGITRTTVFTLRERNNGELGYAYETLNQDYTVKYANTHHVGTQQPYAEWDDNLEKCPIPLPPVNLRQRYSDIISAYIDAVIERNLENQQLASLRDFLLPLLMNGQVKIQAAKG